MELRLHDASDDLRTIFKHGRGATLHEAVDCAATAEPESAPEDWDELL